jgi:hypothetical protein
MAPSSVSIVISVLVAIVASVVAVPRARNPLASLGPAAYGNRRDPAARFRG